MDLGGLFLPEGLALPVLVRLTSVRGELRPSSNLSRLVTFDLGETWFTVWCPPADRRLEADSCTVLYIFIGC